MTTTLRQIIIATFVFATAALAVVVSAEQDVAASNGSGTAATTAAAAATTVSFHTSALVEECPSSSSQQEQGQPPFRLDDPNIITTAKKDGVVLTYKTQIPDPEWIRYDVLADDCLTSIPTTTMKDDDENDGVLDSSLSVTYNELETSDATTRLQIKINNDLLSSSSPELFQQFSPLFYKQRSTTGTPPKVVSEGQAKLCVRMELYNGIPPPPPPVLPADGISDSSSSNIGTSTGNSDAALIISLETIVIFNVKMTVQDESFLLPSQQQQQQQQQPPAATVSTSRSAGEGADSTGSGGDRHHRHRRHLRLDSHRRSMTNNDSYKSAADNIRNTMMTKMMTMDTETTTPTIEQSSTTITRMDGNQNGSESGDHHGRKLACEETWGVEVFTCPEGFDVTMVDDPLPTTTITMPPTNKALAKNLPVRLCFQPNAAAKAANVKLKDIVDLQYEATYTDPSSSSSSSSSIFVEQMAIDNFDVSNDRLTMKACSDNANNNNQVCVVETTLYVALFAHENKDVVAKGRTVFQPGQETGFKQVIVDFELPIQISPNCIGDCPPFDYDYDEFLLSFSSSSSSSSYSAGSFFLTLLSGFLLPSVVLFWG